MPELPEVETVAAQLNSLLQGKKLKEFLVQDPKLSLAERRKPRRPLKVVAVRRIGKEVAIEFDSAVLVVHLRMTGRLIWNTKTSRTIGKFVHGVSASEKHTRAELLFSGGKLSFVDPRRFGTLGWFPSIGSVPIKGIDPMGKGLTISALMSLMDRSSQPIKPWLLRQDRLVGIGNIYASEILFRAKIHPQRKVKSITEVEGKLLVTTIRKVLQEAITSGGTTFSDYRQSDGSTGGYQNRLRVYERSGKRCLRCSNQIERMVQAGRSTYLCKACQR